ncbi:MAG: beta-galactosidase trimerization domain-containing protein [Phycisphaeraceae bacterium]|nr:beta-galactosidase trimerization domain-containing protein [Phycisphaeraceae bacterium]
MPSQANQTTAQRLSQVMRWGQLTMVADDPGRFDPGFWLDYFKRTRVEGVCLNAGGCMAFYPTEVPLHPRSEFLGDGDPFGELVEGCKEMGLVVLARTDPHACTLAAAQAHPDWVRVDAEGRPVRHWAYPEKYWATCTLGPFNFQFMTEVTSEIIRRYPIDGIFCNRWADTKLCHCRHCRQSFTEATGKELPGSLNQSGELKRIYLEWWNQRMFDLWRLWQDRAEAIRQGVSIVPNVGGGTESALDMVRIGELSAMGVADRQARSGWMPMWAAGKNAREYRAVFGDKGIAGLFSVGLEEANRWKDSVQHETELRMWVIEGIANGFRPWYCKFAGYPHDHRWFEPVASIYQWHAANQRYLRHTANLARIGMVYSQQSGRNHIPAQPGSDYGEHGKGFYHALIESRMPFEMVHDQRLAEADIDRFKLLVLPNVSFMSDEQCGRLRSFVDRGGSIIATLETSLYDEQGKRRGNFGLADVLGADCIGPVRFPLQNTYLRLNHEAGHPVLAGLGDAPRIIHGTQRLECRARGRIDAAPVTLIPSYPDLPMEEVYPRGERPDQPELFLQTHGAGRVAYFNWDIDRAFWRFMAVDHLKLLINTIRWALNESPPVEVRGAGLIEVILWRQAQSMTVHLVNLTNPMLFKAPLRELIPSPPQKVRLTLPTGARPGEIKLLVSGKRAEANVSGATVELTLDSILDHEVVAIDLLEDR